MTYTNKCCHFNYISNVFIMLKKYVYLAKRILKKGKVGYNLGVNLIGYLVNEYTIMDVLNLNSISLLLHTKNDFERRRSCSRPILLSYIIFI